MRSLLRAGLLASFAVLAACSSTTTGTGDPSSSDGTSGDPSRRRLSATAIGDGRGTLVTATVLGENGAPTTLGADEVFHTRVQTTEQVLVQTSDEKGLPIYRAQLPFITADAVVELYHERRGASLRRQVATMRLAQPFVIKTAPTSLRAGEELRLEIGPTTSRPVGVARMAFEGSCLAETMPADVQTYGGTSETRFDTTRLAMTTSGCNVDATLMFVNESNVFGEPFDNLHSPGSKGIQQRKLTFYLSR